MVLRKNSRHKMISGLAWIDLASPDATTNRYRLLKVTSNDNNSNNNNSMSGFILRPRQRLVSLKRSTAYGVQKRLPCMPIDFRDICLPSRMRCNIGTAGSEKYYIAEDDCNHQREAETCTRVYCYLY